MLDGIGRRYQLPHDDGRVLLKSGIVGIGGDNLHRDGLSGVRLSFRRSGARVKDSRNLSRRRGAGPRAAAAEASAAASACDGQYTFAGAGPREVHRSPCMPAPFFIACEWILLGLPGAPSTGAQSLGR